jgi:hypothetical protein
MLADPNDGKEYRFWRRMQQIFLKIKKLLIAGYNKAFLKDIF